jgi:hypothetical protein
VRLYQEDRLLTDREFVEYCDRLGFPSATVELIKKIRSSPPSRRVGGGRESVPGSYSSFKNGFTVQFESHKVEFHLVYKLEHDPDVLEYYCQPQAIQLRYLGLSGKRVVVWHTPDYFVLWRDRAGWVEAKHKDELPTLAEGSPNRYRLLVDNRWECPVGREYAEQLGLCYEVHSSASVSPDFVRNAQFLDDYWRVTDPVSPASIEAVLECLSRSPAMTLEDLLSETKDTVPTDDVYQLLARRTIHFDWSAAPLVEPARVHIFADEQAAVQFSASAKRDRMSVGLINLRANGQLDWDGKSWKILNIGNNNVSLLGEGNQFTELPGLVIEDLIRQGKRVRSVSVGLAEGVGIMNRRESNAKHQRLISSARPVRLQEDYEDSRSTLVVPPRSLLYAIDPMGIGTPLVESFTSYVMRVANEHDLTTKEVAAIAFSGMLNPTRDATPFIKYAHSLDGISDRAANWVSRLEIATSRAGLQYLTLLPFRQVVVDGLFCFHRKWCAAVDAGRLVWSSTVTVLPLRPSLRRIQPCASSRISPCEPIKSDQFIAGAT